MRVQGRHAKTRGVSQFILSSFMGMDEEIIRRLRDEVIAHV